MPCTPSRRIRLGTRSTNHLDRHLQTMHSKDLLSNHPRFLANLHLGHSMPRSQSYGILQHHLRHRNWLDKLVVSISLSFTFSLSRRAFVLCDIVQSMLLDQCFSHIVKLQVVECGSHDHEAFIVGQTAMI